MPASLSAEEIRFLPMTPERSPSKDPMTAAGASTLKVEREGPAVQGVEGVREVGIHPLASRNTCTCKTTCI